MATRRRQLLRLATSDQLSEELPVPDGGETCDANGTNGNVSSGTAWQRLQELERRLRSASQQHQQPPSAAGGANNNNKPPPPLCQACHQPDRQYLLWRLPPDAVQLGRQAGLSTAEWARAVTRAAEPASPVFLSLMGHLRGDGALAFDQSELASRLLADVAGLLSELVSCQLSAELPAIFGGATVTLIGGWAQETALAAEFPVLDFVVSLPEWARAGRLCLCQLAPASGGVAVRRPGSQPPPDQPGGGLHQACAAAMEAAVAHKAQALLRPGRHPRLRACPELGWWRQPGRDSPPESAQAKKLRLNLAWRGGSCSRRCGVNVWFGVPVLLLTEPRLRGHLLLGASEPRLLRLAVEERRWALSRSRGCDDPVPLLCRAAKFALKLAEYLAEDVSMTGEHRRDPGLAFRVNAGVRELALRCADCREALAPGGNLQDRLLDLLRWLRDRGAAVPVFTAAVRVDGGGGGRRREPPAASAAPLSESAESVLRYLERACAATAVEDLLPTMLQYFRLKNQPEGLRRPGDDDRILGLATQISFDLLTTLSD